MPSARGPLGRVDVRRLQAAAGNAAVSALLGRTAVQRTGCGIGCECTSCRREDDERKDDGPTAVQRHPVPTGAPAIVVARDVVDPTPPAGGTDVNLIGLTHNDGRDMKGEVVKRGPSTKLRPRPSTDPTTGVLRELPVNTRMVVDHRLGSWYHVVLDTAETGWVAVDLVTTDLPDPQARFHRIGTGETAFDLVKNFYKVTAKDKFHNLRFFANGLVEVNRRVGRTGIYEPSDDEKAKLQVEAFRSGGRFVYVGAGTREQYQIIVPSREFATSLDVSSGSWVRDIAHSIGEWVEGAVAAIAFPAGLVVGALECLWDTVSGIVKLVWGLIKGLVTGSVIDDLRQIATALVTLAKDPQRRQQLAEALGDWLDTRWNNSNPIKMWYWRGWIIGYLSAEVILTFLSGGQTLLAKAGEKFAKLARLVRSTQAGGKALAALESAAQAAKGSKAAAAISKAAETVKGTKVATVVGATGRAMAAAVIRAQDYVSRVLGFPLTLIRRISDQGLLALERLSPLATRILKRLDPRQLLDFLGCRSPCRFDPLRLERRLVEKAAAEAATTTAAAKRADRAVARARAAAEAAAKDALAAQQAAAKTAGKSAARRAQDATRADEAAQAVSKTAERLNAAEAAAADAKLAQNTAEQALAVRKAQRAESLAVSAELGELRRYRTRHAADVLVDDADRTALDDIITRLERREITGAQAKAEREALIARANAKLESYQPAVLGAAQPHVVSASAAKSMEKLEAARQGLVARRAAVDQEINRLAAKAGVDPDDIPAAVRALRAQNRHADARALQRLDDEYEALGLKLVKKSEELGMVAARDFAQSRGAVPLYEGPPGTPGTLDLVHHNPGPPVVLFVCEAKGGSSVLGTRNIGGVRYQQGTATYLRWMLANDAGFRAAAQRQGLLRLIEEGTITVEYHLVRAPGGQRVLINQFDIVAP